MNDKGGLKRKGFFITLEGIDGSGKSSFAEVVVEKLKKNYGLDVVTTREPGGTREGEAIRKILDNDNFDLSPKAELLLFESSRAQLSDTLIIPRLLGDEVVLSDRFYDSTTAYQGDGRGIKKEIISYLNQFSTDGLVPDLTLLFDVSAEVALERKKKQGELKRMDKETLDFYREVRRAYLGLCEGDKEGRWEIIDAERSPHEVFIRMYSLIEGRLAGAGFIERPPLGKERLG